MNSVGSKSLTSRLSSDAVWLDLDVSLLHPYRDVWTLCLEGRALLYDDNKHHDLSIRWWFSSRTQYSSNFWPQWLRSRTITSNFLSRRDETMLKYWTSKSQCLSNRLHSLLYSAFTDKLVRNCHFPAPGRNCTTHRQALQDFPDTTQVSLYKNNKINSPMLQEVLKMMSPWQYVPVYQRTHCIKLSY
jgi:hypothetical protein